ncbi:MAG: GNAT family N-acetyltransferase [Vicinamibacterales bacterium]
MNARTLDPGELSRVEPLVQAYPFKPYRNYRVLPRKAQAAVLLAEIAGTLDDKDGLLCWQQDGDGEAVAVARVLEWDSGFFGVPMGRIEYVITSDRGLVARAVEHAVEKLRERGVRHISARVDVADVDSMAVFEASGFRVMDALVTYITRPRKEPPNEVREVGAIRAFRPDDGPALVEIAADAYRGFRGRFHIDPHIPDDRADALYREWAEQCVGARMADMVLVSEGTDGRLLGFLAFRRREPVSSVGGVAVFGGGLGACRADAPGAYAGLIRAGTIWAHERDGVAECQTQNYNFPVIRIYEAVGAHYVRAEYTLHRWIE